MYPVPKIPPPRLRLVENLTPFAIRQCDKMGPGRRFHDTVVVKGEFELLPGTLALLGRAPIAPADEYWDPSNATRSSVRTPGDMILTKPSTDVIVTGTAHAPGGRASRQWDVVVMVRDARDVLLRHHLEVTGPRHWEHHALEGWTLSPAMPTREVPIRYELAYGGSYTDANAQTVLYENNPCGRGFCNVRALDKKVHYDAPQWQIPTHPVTGLNRDVPLAGLGPVARHWRARSRYAGTYDAEWEQEMREGVLHRLPPDYARDFDTRFFQCAHPALVTRQYLRGDETIGLAGLVAGAPEFVTRLPGLGVSARIDSPSGRFSDMPLPLDTVHIDLDARRAYLSWRLSLDQSLDVRAAFLHVQRMG